MVKKNEKIKCKAYLASLKGSNFEIKPCFRNATKLENMLCNGHEYMSDFTDEQLEEIKNGYWNVCKRCRHFIKKTDGNKLIPRCYSCLNDRKKQHQNDKQKKIKDKCNWKDRNMNNCRGMSLENGYCKFHQYVTNYTEDEKKNSKMCNGCKKVKYLGDYGTCDICRNRGNKNRIIVKEKKVYCKDKDCKNGVKENGYCGKHQRIWMKNKLDEIGTHKTCTNFIRGCDANLEIDDEFNKCEDCRKNDRINDKKNRKSKIIIVNDDNKKQCSNCFKIKNKDQFIGSRQRLTQTCYECRLTYSKADEKRPNRERDYSEYDNRPEVKERKKQWRDENYEKVAMYWQNFRERQIKKFGEDFWKNNAESMRKWRNNNPDKVKEENRKKRINIQSKYNNYKNRAYKYGIEFNLSIEKFKEYVLDDCYYCKDKIDINNKLNEVDRKNNKNYCEEECVSSCNMCNMMKSDKLNDIEFIKASEHILTNQGLINRNKYL